MRITPLRVRRLALASMCVALVAGCSSSGGAGAPDDGRLQVVTTVSPITNIVQNVAGDHASVTGIVPEGTNSHTFEPAPSDAAVMESADIVFMNGLHLEEPTRELAEANLGEGVPLVQLGDETIGPDEYIYDFSFPRKPATRTRTCGRTPCMPSATPRSWARSSRHSTRPTPGPTAGTPMHSRPASTSSMPSCARSQRPCRPTSAPCSPITTRSRTSRGSTAGASSARCSPPTSPTPRHRRSPA